MKAFFNATARGLAGIIVPARVLASICVPALPRVVDLMRRVEL